VPLEPALLAATPLPPAPAPPLADPVAPPPAPLEVPAVAAVVPLVLAAEPEAGSVVVPLLGVPLPPPPPLPLPPPPLAPVAPAVPLLTLLPLDVELPLFWPALLVGELLLHAAPTRSAAHGAAWSQSVRFILHRV